MSTGGTKINEVPMQTGLCRALVEDVGQSIGFCMEDALVLGARTRIVRVYAGVVQMALGKDYISAPIPMGGGRPAVWGVSF